MSLKDIVSLRFNSALLRGVLKRFYQEGDVCRVPMGPLRGARLVYHSSVNFHAILGIWDLDVFRFLNTVLIGGRLIGPESVVADVGANIGFYTLWFAPRVKSVQAFEPSPEPQKLLAENLAANDIRNVTVVKAACGATNGTVDFFLASHHHASSLHASWAKGDRSAEPPKITVPVVTLDSQFGDGQKTWPDLIKMDIEGGGTYALPGAARCIAERRPFLLVESHTPDEDRAISNVLTANDYAAYRFNTRKWVAERGATHPNPKGVWGTMFLCPAEKRQDVMARI
jgi:FkbM family methyltransferase